MVVPAVPATVIVLAAATAAEAPALLVPVAASALQA